MRILEHLTLLSPGDLIPYAEALTASMALLLEPAVPRRILQTLNKLWMGLNTVMPRRYIPDYTLESEYKVQKIKSKYESIV